MFHFVCDYKVTPFFWWCIRKIFFIFYSGKNSKIFCRNMSRELLGRSLIMDGLKVSQGSWAPMVWIFGLRSFILT